MANKPQKTDQMETDQTDDYVMVPNIKEAEQYKQEGNESYKKKDYNEALIKYTKAIELVPDSHIYLGNRSAVYISLNKYNLALRDASDACTLDNTYIKGYSRQLKCTIALGNLAAVKNLFKYIKENVILNEPPHITFRLEFEQMNNLENYLVSAKLAESKNEFRQASYYYKIASEIAVADTNTKALMAKYMALSGKVVEAHAILLPILQKNSTDALAILCRGICFYLEDNTEKALNHFTQTLKMAPDMTEAKLYRNKCKELQKVKLQGNEFFKSEKYEEAILTYTEALNIDPNNKITNAKLYFNRALARSKSKIKDSDPDLTEVRDRMVVKDCDSAICLDAEYTKAYRRRGYALQNIGEHEKALRDFEQVYKLEPSRENKNAINTAKKQQKLAERKDYYKILKISKDANEIDIKKAYKKQALLHHPDRHATASDEEKLIHEKNFKDVNEAFSILSDPTKKTRYDNGQDVDGRCSGMGDFDANLIFQQFFGGGGRSGFSSSGGSSGRGGNSFVFSFG